jgi:hypothetical protein
MGSCRGDHGQRGGTPCPQQSRPRPDPLYVVRYITSLLGENAHAHTAIVKIPCGVVAIRYLASWLGENVYAHPAIVKVPCGVVAIHCVACLEKVFPHTAIVAISQCSCSPFCVCVWLAGTGSPRVRATAAASAPSGTGACQLGPWAPLRCPAPPPPSSPATPPRSLCLGGALRGWQGWELGVGVATCGGWGGYWCLRARVCV